MKYLITENEIHAMIEFAKKHPEYDFHTERVATFTDETVLSCIFLDKNDNNKIWELNGKEKW